MKSLPTRKLQRAHFAFMRALLQGVDARESWNRYLRSEGEATDLRTVRQTVGWIRDEFAAAAQREARPGMARLVRLDPDRFAPDRALPTLEAFAAERGMEDFSEAEQAEAYAEAYPEAVRARAVGGRGGGRSQRPSQRARVIARQLEALRWLESHVAQDPRASDPVAAWLNPAIASRLQSVGLLTLGDVAAAINMHGARWWRRVPGVGPLKADRVVAWMRAQEELTGLRLQAHALSPRSQLTIAVLQQAVPPATAIAPLERFRMPPALDGKEGQFRAPAERCRLRATDDLAAIMEWLSAKGVAASAASRRTGAPVLDATRRSYRKEAERLLLWSTLTRGKAVSSLDAEDAAAYCRFLAAPTPDWCGPRHHQRWSAAWRPLEGPLSDAARQHAVTVLRSLFSHWLDHGYVTANPFAAHTKRRKPRPTLGSGRLLTVTQWDDLNLRLEHLPDTDPARRLRRAMRWLYATGLRLGELVSACCGDLARHDDVDAGGRTVERWSLRVTGRRAQAREVEIPATLVAELKDELARQAIEGELDAADIRRIPVLACFDGSRSPPRPWSASGLSKAIRAEFERMADGTHGPGAEKLAKASAHWLRHSHGVHALQGRAGTAAAALQRVQNNLGHLSPGTTAAYLVADTLSQAREDAGEVGSALVRGSGAVYDSTAPPPYREPIIPGQ